MTVSATAPYVAYAGAGTSGPFAIPFRFLANGDLVITKTDEDGVETTLTGNTITGAGDDDGGELNTAAVIAVGEMLEIRRSTARSQTAQYVANGPFPAATHERALDKAMLVSQELDHDLLNKAGSDFNNVDPPTGRAALNVYSVDDINARVSTIYEDIDAATSVKADLVAGKVPLAQLPPAAADALKATQNLGDVTDKLAAAGNIELDPQVTGSKRAALSTIWGPDFVNPHNFEIDFNGGNSAAGLQALFDAAAGRSLVLPPGLFSTNVAITLAKGKPYDVVGAQGNVYGNGVSGGTVLRNTSTTGGHLLVYDDSALTNQDMIIGRIENLTLFGNALSGDNLRIHSGHGLTLRKIWSTTAGANAINFVQDCWSNVVDGCAGVQSGECGLRLGRRSNAFEILGGSFIANARKTHGGATFANLGLYGEAAGFESRHINLVGQMDVSYAGENPFSGATVTRAHNFYANHVFGLHGSIYSEDGIGDALGNSISIGGTNSLVNLAMVYLQNRGMLVMADNVRAAVHVLAQTRNVTADFSGVTGECDIMSHLELVGGFTATLTQQARATHVPAVIKTGGAGSVTVTGATVEHAKRAGYVDFEATIPVTAYTGPINGLYIPLPIAAQAGTLTFCTVVNQSTAAVSFAAIDGSGITTIGNPIGGLQTIVITGRYPCV